MRTPVPSSYGETRRHGQPAVVPHGEPDRLCQDADDGREVARFVSDDHHGSAGETSEHDMREGASEIDRTERSSNVLRQPMLSRR